MSFQIPSGQIITLGQPFSILRGNRLFNFPSNWLEHATDDDLTEWGIKRVS